MSEEILLPQGAQSVIVLEPDVQRFRVGASERRSGALVLDHHDVLWREIVNQVCGLGRYDHLMGPADHLDHLREEHHGLWEQSESGLIHDHGFREHFGRLQQQCGHADESQSPVRNRILALDRIRPLPLPPQDDLTRLFLRDQNEILEGWNGHPDRGYDAGVVLGILRLQHQEKRREIPRVTIEPGVVPDSARAPDRCVIGHVVEVVHAPRAHAVDIIGPGTILLQNMNATAFAHLR